MKQILPTQQKKENERELQEIKKYIQIWIKPLGWKFKNFEELLELLGVRQPVKFGDFNKEKLTFKVSDSINEAKIYLRFADNIYQKSAISIEIDGNIYEYAVACNYEKAKKLQKKDIFLVKKVIRQKRLELHCSYEEYNCKWSLTADKNDTLSIEISSYDIYMALKKSEQIEEYLLCLTDLKNKEFSSLYEEILQIIAPDRSPAGLKKVLILSTFKEDKRNRLKGKVLLENGERTEYAILKDEITYFVNKNGTWRCSYKDMELKGRVQTFNCKELQKMIKGVKEEILRMSKILG